MTENDFVGLAKKAGYSEEEIQDLLDFQKESGIPFEDLPLMDRLAD